MGSPITFSGFNNIDFGSIVTALMQQASAPLTTLQTSQTALKTQITNYSTLGGRISSLQSAADALADQSTVSAFAGTSSDTSAVGVSTSGTARAGHYDIVVNELARSQVTVSTSSTADASTTVVASGGTLTIGGVGVTITGNSTLQQLADAINGTDGIGVTASVIRTAPGAYRLALTSADTGAANAFTITNALTGGTGVTFGGNAVEATDASLLVNNIAVTSDSNTLEDVLPGVTITALKKDPLSTVRVDVAPDSAGLKARVGDFITAYNSLVKFDNDQRTAAGEGDSASIGHAPMLRQLRTSLRQALLGAYGAGTISRLAEAGVELTQTGTLQLNDTVFDAAVAANAEGVQALFAGADGVFPAVTTLLDDYSQADGFIPKAKTQLAAQIKRMDTQIANMQDRLAAERLALQQEFAAADAAIKALNTQKDTLTSFSNSLGTSL